MYKIFIRTNILLITNSPLKNVKGAKKVFLHNSKDDEIISNLVKHLNDEKTENETHCLYGKNISLVWKLFSKHYTLIRAGGGLVRNDKNEILFIFRNGKWDLPKGKVEKTESIENCAVREVQEECGLENLVLIKHLTDTYHTYNIGPNQKLKKTSWYRMFSNDVELTPQIEEGITKIKWVKESKLKKVLDNTFSSIPEVIKAELKTTKTPAEKIAWEEMINFE